MPDATDANFLAGVIEGFYGPPWSPAERAELLTWMADGGLNTYLYAPKDDLKHRAAWRASYEPAELEPLAVMARACRERGIRFIYALSPGLDIRYSDADELARILARFEQMRGLGVEDFALLFDDIPDRMHPDDRRRWPSFAAAQCHVANAAFEWVRARQASARFLFCPTPYCQRMADRQLGGADYLETVGRELTPEIDVFWTGPEIISREISVAHLRDLHRTLRRRPLIWDNLHANDYDGRRFFCGPYAGRPPELRSETRGILCNPNTEFPLNYVPLRTFAAWVANRGSWDPRAEYIAALQEWLPRFATLAELADLDDLRLFGDCHYLPHEEGPDADALYQRARQLLARTPAQWGDAADEQESDFCRQAARLRDFCARVADVLDRPLFHALHRRTWELREELDLLLGYVRARRANPSAAYRPDSHLPGTYRGGMVARLQDLLAMRGDGSFEPATPDT